MFILLREKSRLRNNGSKLNRTYRETSIEYWDIIKVGPLSKYKLLLHPVCAVSNVTPRSAFNVTICTVQFGEYFENLSRKFKCNINVTLITDVLH